MTDVNYFRSVSQVNSQWRALTPAEIPEKKSMSTSLWLRWKHSVAALLLFFATGLPAIPAHAQMVDALNRAYKRATEDFKDLGLDGTKQAGGNYIFSIRGAWLRKGEAKISMPVLTPGVKYAIIAAGNKHIKKVSLQILDPKKRSIAKEGDPVLTESSEDSNAPGCNVFLDKAKYGTQPYTVGVRISVDEMEDEDAPKEDGWVCYMILREDGGWDVPLESFETATASFQERLDAIKAANPNGAEIAFDSIPLQGVVLPPGATATVSGIYEANKKFKIIAASDENTDSVAVGVGGVMKAPTAGELGDGKPTLKYTTGIKPTTPGQNGIWSVKNTGKKTAVILTAVIYIIEGS